METKREKFVRLAEKRTENVLNGLRLLGNLANTRNYDYSDEDVIKIVKALRSALSDLEHSFSSANKTTSFKL